MSFNNKVVLITGGSAGLGAATAEQFAKQGATIAIVGRNEANLKEVAQKCQEYGGQTLAIKADITKNAEVKTIVAQVIRKFGKLDILVNNAGVFRSTSILSPNAIEIYDEVMNTNLRATVLITSLAAPFLKETKGNIINLSSVLGQTLLSTPKFMMYSASKAALNTFTRGVALELAAFGVRVNLISPGPVLTNMLSGVDPSVTTEDYKEMTALKKVALPEEVAEVIMFLAGDKAVCVTGANYVVDCGLLLKC